MEFKINTSELQQQLSLVKGVVLPKATIPIVEMYKFDIIDNNTLSITATDFETRISTKTNISDAIYNDMDKSICVSAKKTNDILSMLKNEIVSFSTKDNNFIIKSSNGTYKIPTASSNEFPAVKSFNNSTQCKLSAQILSQGLKTTIFACDIDDTKPILSGVNIFASDNIIKFTATDSHKLARFETNIDDNFNINAVLPNKSCSLLQKIAEQNINDIISITFDNNNIKFSCGNFELFSRTIDGNFPNCDRVIPSNFASITNITTHMFKESIKRVAYFSNAKSNLVILNIKNNNITISANDFDTNQSASESLLSNPSTVEQNVDISIGFKSKFLLEIMEHIPSADFNIYMNDPNRACVFKDSTDKSSTFLLMPMCIQ